MAISFSCLSTLSILAVLTVVFFNPCERLFLSPNYSHGSGDPSESPYLMLHRLDYNEIIFTSPFLAIPYTAVFHPPTPSIPLFPAPFS